MVRGGLTGWVPYALVAYADADAYAYAYAYAYTLVRPPLTMVGCLWGQSTVLNILVTIETPKFEQL